MTSFEEQGERDEERYEAARIVAANGPRCSCDDEGCDECDGWWDRNEDAVMEQIATGDADWRGRVTEEW